MKDRKSELLEILQEESAEVVQAISKISRFGADSDNKGKLPNTNQVQLELEIGDFLGVLKLLIEENYVNGEKIQESANNKIIKLESYMTHTKAGNKDE